jgi:NaMN:DMB phosphoribosyltransferase
VGAGPLPVDAHRRRPPIPIVPVDARARDAAAARGADAATVWLAAVTGGDGAGADPPRLRVVDAGTIEVLATTLAPFRDAAGMDVAHLALAVDAGRAIAARAAADGVTVLVAGAPPGRDDTAGRALAAVLTGAADPVPNGALGALRRRGDATAAVLCGVALGAGEHGLGCVCDGLAALAGAAVAAGIEPDLRPRLIAGRPSTDPAYAALAAHLGVADGAALVGLAEDPAR